MSFSLIAAVGENHEIGKANQLIFPLKQDLAFFRRQTIGHPVIMGLSTWLSLPAPLKKREHFVLAHPHQTVSSSLKVVPFVKNSPHLGDQNYLKVIHHLSDFLQHHPPGDYFVIGGATVYTQFLPHAHQIYLTKIHAQDPAADTFFPAFPEDNYQKTLLGSGQEGPYRFDHLLFTRKD